MASEFERGAEEKLLTEDAAEYKSCIVVDIEKLKRILDCEVGKKRVKLEEAQAKKKESIKAFEKFQAMQKEMFDNFIKQQQSFLSEKDVLVQEGQEGATNQGLALKADANHFKPAFKSTGKYTS